MNRLTQWGTWITRRWLEKHAKDVTVTESMSTYFPKKSKPVYIGDGVYATYAEYPTFNESAIQIETQRENGLHWIVLGPEVFDELIQFAISIGWLKKGEVSGMEGIGG